MTTRLRLALIFGGRSLEHEVSVVSARSVSRAFDADRYEVVPMAIDRHGRWADEEASRRVLEESGDRTDQASPITGGAALGSELLDGSIDVAFPVLHGPFGEDGTIQGLLEMLDIPYVGCGVAASALCMDKRLTKRLLAHAGLATPRWIEIGRRSWREGREALVADCLGLGLPLFVKPARLGSSVGISKVERPDALAAAVDQALGHDDDAIAEAAVDGREIEVAVLGDRSPRASVPGEVVPGHEFYDYADKYLDDDCALLAPAPLEDDVADAARRVAVRAYTVLGCSGMARVDLFLNRPDGRFLVNEVNTIPGFTSISMYPRLWGLTGLEFPALLDELVRLAVVRHERRRRTGDVG